jgi:hypothetical protein
MVDDVCDGGTLGQLRIREERIEAQTHGVNLNFARPATNALAISIIAQLNRGKQLFITLIDNAENTY